LIQSCRLHSSAWSRSSSFSYFLRVSFISPLSLAFLTVMVTSGNNRGFDSRNHKIPFSPRNSQLIAAIKKNDTSHL